MPSRPLAVRSRDSFAAGDRDFDDRVGAGAEPRGDLFEVGADHRARRGIDRRLSDRQRQAGASDRADAFAGLEAHACAGRRETDGRDDQRAMGDVRIIARVLDDAGAGEIRRRVLGWRGRIPAASPFGSATGTGSGNWPVRSASKAARAAPLAQAPVVQPRLSGVALSASFMGVGLARDRPPA